MSAPSYLLDTNVLIRFLVHDDPVQSPQADALFAEAGRGDCSLVLSDVAIAESVWVLSAAYKIDRNQIAETLSALLGKAGIRCENRECLIDALSRYKSTRLDFMDCYLAAMAVASNTPVASFDKDFRKFKDVVLRKF